MSIKVKYYGLLQNSVILTHYPTNKFILSLNIFPLVVFLFKQIYIGILIVYCFIIFKLLSKYQTKHFSATIFLG